MESNRAIVTTSWDDGHKLDLKVARLLEKYGIKGTFYVSTFYLKDRLTNDNIREIDNFHEIRAHTLSHVTLTSVSFERAKKEIEGSKNIWKRF